jgi:hypothetical protein
MHLRLAAILLAASLAIPLVNAVPWGAKGQYEPDTSFDRTNTYMWQTADTARLPTNTVGVTDPNRVGHHVYFNAFTEQNTAYSLHGYSDNPNFATVQSSRGNWPGTLGALLGVWKDCNHDNYVGFGDNALFEYRAELLVKTDGTPDWTVCPVVALGAVPGGANSHNFVTVHNDGSWVREFIPLGPDAARSDLIDSNPFDLNDNGARVWADWKNPGEAPYETRCSVVFGPEDSYHSTGAILSMVDCVDGFFIVETFDAVTNATHADTLGLGRISFTDHPHDPEHSASILNKPNPWGTQNQASYATVWDCSQPQVPGTHQQPTNTIGVGVSHPSTTPNPNLAGTPAGTANETATGLDDCNKNDNQQGTTTTEWEASVANAPYANEKDGVSNYVLIKDQSDFPMSYSEGQRILGATLAPLGRQMATDSARAYDSEGLWTSDTRIAEDRNPYVNRDQAENRTLAPVQNMTSYAYVSPGAVTKYALLLNPSGQLGTYGAEVCGASLGDVGGWRCDGTRWYPNGCLYSCSGLIDGATVPVMVRVGQPYQLRDVDCYDQSIGALRGAGISWGTLTGTSCS